MAKHVVKECYILPHYDFFITLISVDAAKVLTQTPPVHTVSPGQEVLLKCNIQRHEGYYVYWYKQVPGSTPQYILRFYHEYSSPDFGTGFSSDRFNSKASSNIDYQFIIKRAEAGDSAVYYYSLTCRLDCLSAAANKNTNHQTRPSSISYTSACSYFVLITELSNKLTSCTQLEM
uniref:Immunoglobulin V-set domain-containing protein n=1 Tax=Haplochromis burtoni TaxID=8153 RepID=A0A3Q2UWD1_HAPBU